VAAQSGGMNTANIKRKLLGCFAALLILAPLGFGAADGDNKSDAKADASAIIAKYLQTTQNHQDTAQSASMQVDIAASVPKLKEQGKLRALRKISKVGHITYRILGFQGDNTIKNQVIARYLQAEQQGQGDESLAIIPSNYKFKYKGTKQENGHDVYVFQLSPRKKRVGLFKGEMWLDTKTYLPVYEKGRLVKSPSIFFKKVDFDRAFAIQNGLAVPQSMSSTIDVRLIGKVHLNINY